MHLPGWLRVVVLITGNQARLNRKKKRLSIQRMRGLQDKSVGMPAILVDSKRSDATAIRVAFFEARNIIHYIKKSKLFNHG
jgi:hypothetical protein